MPQREGLVEEARREAKGDKSNFSMTWNTVSVGTKEITVERLKPSPTQKRLPLAQIKISYISEKAPHKHKCELCQGWYESFSVKYKVPNYR